MANFATFVSKTLIFSPPPQKWMNLISNRLSTVSIKYKNWPSPVFGQFQNGCNKVVTEPCVVQFWSEIILVISNSAYDLSQNCTPLSSVTIINTQCGIWIVKARVVLKLFYRLHFVLFFFFLREWNVHQVTHISGTSKLWCGLTQSPESGYLSCFIREISNGMLKVIWNCIRFALLC